MRTNYPLLRATCAGLIVGANLCVAAPSTAGKPTVKSSFPTSGKVLKLTNGDLMCYVDLVDVRGKKYYLGANFDICQQSKLINKQVQLTYHRGTVNDCQSNEPCGKSRTVNLVSSMKLIRAK